MNIIYIGSFRLPNYDAGAPRVINNAKAFRSIGHNVSFVSWGGKYRECDLCIDGKYRTNGFEYIITDELPFNSCSMVNRIFKKLKRGNKSINILTKMVNKPDLIIMYNADYSFSKKMLRFCHKYNIKLANDINEWFSNNELHIWDILKNSINMKRVQHKIPNKIVISSFLDNYYNTSNNVLIPPLCDKEETKWYNEITDDRVGPFSGITFIYAGIPTKKDCLYTFIESVNTLAKKGNNVRFIVIGITKEQFMTNYSNYITDKDLHNNIIFLGRISQDLVPAYYKKADFMVLFREPNRKNMAGFPTKIAESITAGVPILTNPTSDIDKYIKNGVNGYILNSYDNDSIVSCIENSILKLKEEELQCMKKNTIESSKSFEWQSYKTMFRNFLDNLI